MTVKNAIHRTDTQMLVLDDVVRENLMGSEPSMHILLGASHFQISQ